VHLAGPSRLLPPDVVLLRGAAVPAPDHAQERRQVAADLAGGGGVWGAAGLLRGEARGPRARRGRHGGGARPGGARAPVLRGVAPPPPPLRPRLPPPPAGGSLS